MSNLIERYVYDVVRRLPERERAEVRRELLSNIYDMLGGSTDEDEVRRVLNSLGAPAVLAESYRQQPRYLISPAVYDDYIRVLKWLLPLVGIVLFVVGGIVGVINSLEGGGTVDGTALAQAIFFKGIGAGVSGAVQALVWATVGFVVAERTGAHRRPAAKSWTIDMLPQEMPNQRGRIPLGDSIAELVVIVTFTVLGILLLLGALPFAAVIQSGEIVVRHLFSRQFVAVFIPVVVVSCLFGVFVCVAKIVKRRWVPLVCGAVVVNSVADIALTLYLFTRPGIFSPAFMQWMQSVEGGRFDLLRFMGQPVGNTLLIIIGAIVVVCAVTESIAAIVKTMRARAGGA